MNFKVKSINNSEKGVLSFGGREFPCALGKNGVIAADEKREGDNKTPIGIWPIRQIFYRKDKIQKPSSPFLTRECEENFGWCDSPNDENYNKFVHHPYPASAEKLWRDDDLYDICVVLGHNDSPVIANMGSAIFMHIARENYGHTEGCVALSRDDLAYLLENCDQDTKIEIIGD